MMGSRAAHARNLIGPLVRSTYRIRVQDSANIPARGAVLIMCDWNNIAAPSVIKAGIPRPIHVWAEGAAALPGPLLAVTGDLAMPDQRPGVGVISQVMDLLAEGEAVAAIGVSDVGYVAAATHSPVMTVSVTAPATTRPTDPPPRKSPIVVTMGTVHTFPDRLAQRPPTRSTARAAGEWIRQLMVDEGQSR